MGWSGKWTLLCRKSKEKCCQSHEALLGTFNRHPQPLSSGAHLSSGSGTSPGLSYAVGVPVSSPISCCCWIDVWFSWADTGHESSLHFAWWLQACHSTGGCQHTALTALGRVLWEPSHHIWDQVLEETVLLEYTHGLRHRHGRAQGSQWGGALVHSIFGFSGH